MWAPWKSKDPLRAIGKVRRDSARYWLAGIVRRKGKRVHRPTNIDERRSLSAEQQQTIALQLREFGGTHFDLYVNPDPESIDLMHDIDAVLTRSNWVRVPAASTGAVIGEKAAAFSWKGVVILAPATHEADFTPRAVALRAALAGAGISTQMGIQPDSYRGPKEEPFVMNPDVIHVGVGAKWIRSIVAS